MEEAGLTRMLLQPIQYEGGDPLWPPASPPATDQIRLESVLVEKKSPCPPESVRGDEQQTPPFGVGTT